jgi:hypothetical protein
VELYISETGFFISNRWAGQGALRIKGKMGKNCAKIYVNILKAYTNYSFFVINYRDSLMRRVFLKVFKIKSLSVCAQMVLLSYCCDILE